MIISVDYDETYTRDKILWDSFIKQAKARGHTVLCVICFPINKFSCKVWYFRPSSLVA